MFLGVYVFWVGNVVIFVDIICYKNLVNDVCKI